MKGLGLLWCDIKSINITLVQFKWFAFTFFSVLCSLVRPLQKTWTDMESSFTVFVPTGRQSGSSWLHSVLSCSYTIQSERISHSTIVCNILYRFKYFHVEIHVSFFAQHEKWRDIPLQWWEITRSPCGLCRKDGSSPHSGHWWSNHSERKTRRQAAILSLCRWERRSHMGK